MSKYLVSRGYIKKTKNFSRIADLREWSKTTFPSFSHRIYFNRCFIQGIVTKIYDIGKLKRTVIFLNILIKGQLRNWPIGQSLKEYLGCLQIFSRRMYIGISVFQKIYIAIAGAAAYVRFATDTVSFVTTSIPVRPWRGYHVKFPVIRGLLYDDPRALSTLSVKDSSRRCFDVPRRGPVIRRFTGGPDIAPDNHPSGMLGISDPDFSENRKALGKGYTHS